MSKAFCESRAAELAALKLSADEMRSATTFEELHSASLKALNRLDGALRDNLLESGEGVEWSKQFEEIEAGRLAQF